MKNRTVAVLLAFFFGGLGLHKAYLNQPGKAILYFIFCWTFIPALVALIDMVILLGTSQEKFDEKYNATNTK